ncbi:DNA-directed RNA polymerase subunit omega [candidate division TA06 bacterium]|nr:DNA-directed RNA polymerase subunit omega [candidate division TA06 bacterium]
MIRISIEEILKIVENKYKAVVIAAKEARRLNVIPREKEEEEEEKENNLKPVEEALKRFVKGELKYVEGEEKK